MSSITYDYIIAGAGCAGLSLLRRMMQHEYFSNKKILLIDKNRKDVNDRTWCFWEQQPGLFQDIVHHQWKQIDFYSTGFSARFDLDPFTYKMIRGIDLYSTVLNEAKQHSNIEILFEEAFSVTNKETTAVLRTTTNEYSAGYIFNSIFFNDWKRKAILKKDNYVLLQHFKGWLIETDKNVFDERIATFMDFRINQEKGTTFIYTLPLAKNKALVEYTLFTDEVLPQKEYDEALKHYVETVLQLKNYAITHTEFGVIPMTNYNFSKGDNRIINIGIAGGQTKASSGYSYQFIQKHTVKIIDALISNKNPLVKESLTEKRFRLYDGIFLNVLCNKKMPGDKLFAQLFQKNPPVSIFRFLDNETTFKEELKIMNSVSLATFLPAAIEEIF